MTAKKLILYGGLAWLLGVAIGSYIEVRWDNAWWAVVCASLIRGVPLGLCLLGVVLWTDSRSRARRRTPDEPPEDEN